MQNKQDKIEEQQHVNKWIERLNRFNDGWVDGDKLNTGKTADIINNDLKIAIELKREKGESLDNENKNLEKLSNRLEEYFKLSNEKFANYPEFKTLLLIELKTPIDTAILAIKGILSLHLDNGKLVGKSIRNNRLYIKTNNMGGLILWPAPGNLLSRECIYYINPNSSIERQLSLMEVENIFDNTFCQKSFPSFPSGHS